MRKPPLVAGWRCIVAFLVWGAGAAMAQHTSSPALLFLGRTNSTPGGPLDSALFCLTNSTDHYVFVAVHDRSKPVFVRERKLATGWVPLDPLPAGYKHSVSLAARESFTFRIPLPSGAKTMHWRVSISWILPGRIESIASPEVAGD